MINSWWLAINWNNIWYKNIPEEYLQYACINEVLCPDILSEEWKCLETLFEELTYVPENIKQDYIKWRLWFFDWIKNYYLSLEQTSENKIYASEVWKCCDYLQTLI